MTADDRNTDDASPVAGAAAPEIPGDRPADCPSREKVLALLFVLLGPVALGVLWKSPRFTRRWKVLLTLLVLLQFSLAVWILWVAANWFLATIAPLWKPG